MTPIDTQTAQKLITQREWLRNLARGLVRDDSRAEDLCQDTLLQALRSPLASRAPRPWLARAVRSLGARLGRDEHRRHRRETVAARKEAEPSAAQVVEQVANQKLVLDAVMKLEEPYRSTVLLRYWEDLPPRELARRMSVPVETARTRLKRGLSLLRQRLDREFGERRAWVTPMTAFMSLGRKSLLLASGAAVVKTKTMAIVAVLAGLALTWALWDNALEPDREPTSPPRPTRGMQEDFAADAGTGGVPLERTAVPAPSVVRETAAAEPAASVRGRIVDSRARPLARTGVRFRGEPGSSDRSGVAARSDDIGDFSLVQPDSSGQIVVDEAGLATVLAGVFSPGQRVEPVVVAAPSLSFGGVIVDQNGSPLAGAQASCLLPEGFRSRFGDVLDFSREEPWITHAAEDGTFLLPDLGRVEGARLHFSMDGYLPVALEQPSSSDEAMQVVLSRPAPVEGSLTGLVVDPSGVPVPDALVSLGSATTASDGNGRFVIDMQAAGRNLDLVAMKRGFLPGTYRLREWEGEFQAADQPFATVRLGGRPLFISGQVVNAEGQPVGGAKVWVADPMVFGDLRQGMGLISVEGYLSGGSTASELMARFMRNGQPIMPVEQILQDNPTAKWRWVKSDDNGFFTLDGLLAHDYTVSAVLAGSLVQVSGGPFSAGTTNVRLVVPEDALLPVVAGRIVDKNGIPVTGVEVRTICDPLTLERVTYTADGRRSTHGSGRSELGTTVLTDQDGRFHLENVGSHLVYLSLSGDKIMPTSYGRSSGLAGSGMPLDGLLVEVSLRLHIRVELSDPSLADRISALDAAGKPINLSIMSGGGIDSYDTVPLRDGRSEVLSVTEDVTTIILYRDGEEVRRIPLTLQPGEVNVIRG